MSTLLRRESQTPSHEERVAVIKADIAELNDLHADAHRNQVDASRRGDEANYEYWTETLGTLSGELHEAYATLSALEGK